MKPTYMNQFKDENPEFYDLFSHFAYDEVLHEPGIELDNQTRYLAIIATLLGSQAIDLYQDMLPDMLDDLTPVEVMEVIYQAVAYLGIGRVYPFLKATGQVLKEKGISLPLEPQATTTLENRREQGTAKQVELFGESYRDAYRSDPQKTVHIRRWLAANCFGDYYTRTGLNNQQREMITFCFLAAQGTEVQLKGHIQGNFNVGNDEKFLIAVASQCMPYIGYPRTLNTLRCIQEVIDQQKEEK